MPIVEVSDSKIHLKYGGPETSNIDWVLGSSESLGSFMKPYFAPMYSVPCTIIYHIRIPMFMQSVGALPLGSLGSGPTAQDWVAVKELKLSCHDSKTRLFTIYPYYGNLNYVP